MSKIHFTDIHNIKTLFYQHSPQFQISKFDYSQECLLSKYYAIRDNDDFWVVKGMGEKIKKIIPAAYSYLILNPNTKSYLACKFQYAQPYCFNLIYCIRPE
jgi:hypothetical protein